MGLQRSPNKSGSFWKKSGQEVSLERPDAPQIVDSGGSGPPTPAHFHVERSVLHGFFLSKMLNWCILSVFVYLFFPVRSLNFVHPVF